MTERLTEEEERERKRQLALKRARFLQARRWSLNNQQNWPISGATITWEDATTVEAHELQNPALSCEDWTASEQGTADRDGWFDFDSAKEELDAIYRYGVPVEMWDRFIRGSGAVATEKILTAIKQWARQMEAEQPVSDQIPPGPRRKRYPRTINPRQREEARRSIERTLQLVASREEG